MKHKLLGILILIFLSACERTVDLERILKFYGDAREDIGYSVAIASDGYIIGGQMTEITRSAGIIRDASKKMGIIKTDFNGNIVWKEYLGGKLQGFGSKIILLDNDTIVCAGQVTDTVLLQTDIFVVKLAPDGSEVVRKIFKRPGNQTSTDILKTGEGYLLLGTTDVERTPVTDSSGNKAGRKDILLRRIYNNLGQIDTPSVTGYPNDDYGAALKSNPDGGYIVLGTTDRTEPGQGGNNLLLWRPNIYGFAAQSVVIGTTDDEYAADLEVLDDGYLLVGTIGKETEDQSVYIAKIPRNISNAPLFTRKIEQTESWSVKAVSRYRANSFVLAGKAGTASSSRMLVFVVDPEGNPVSGKEMVTGSSGIQIAYDVVSDDEGNIIAIGKNDIQTNTLITLLKFRF
jgi:hypothetical protein